MLFSGSDPRKVYVATLRTDQITENSKNRESHNTDRQYMQWSPLIATPLGPVEVRSESLSDDDNECRGQQ